MLKTFYIKPKILFYGLVIIILGFVIFLFMSTQSQNVSAQASEAQKKAEAFCNAKSGYSDAEKAACRNGYRGSYQDNESEAVSCGSKRPNPYSTEKQKKACNVGWEQGKEDKPANTASGRLGEDGEFICGTLEDKGASSDRNVHTKFDFGCLGTAYAKSPGSFPTNSVNISPIMDFALAIVRFLSIGVGIAITIALIMSGIQYSASEGNAEASTKAKKRVESAITGLVIYIFAFSLLQFLIPGGVFK